MTDLTFDFIFREKLLIILLGIVMDVFSIRVYKTQFRIIC